MKAKWNFPDPTRGQLQTVGPSPRVIASVTYRLSDRLWAWKSHLVDPVASVMPGEGTEATREEAMSRCAVGVTIVD